MTSIFQRLFCFFVVIGAAFPTSQLSSQLSQDELPKNEEVNTKTLAQAIIGYLADSGCCNGRDSDDCLSNDAPDQEVITCEGNVARLTCPPDTVIRVIEANYGRSDFPTCPHPQRSNLDCGNQERSATVVRNLCDNRRHCVVTAKNGVFGDPCFGTYKYLRVKYSCDKAFSINTCEGGTATLSCPTGLVIQILKARYGRTEFQPCPHPARGNLNCGSPSNSLGVVQEKCQGKSSCMVPASNGVFGDPCGGTYKYLEATWICVKAAPNVIKRKLACEGHTLNLNCPQGTIQIRKANYGRTVFATCPHSARSNLNCRSPNSLSIVERQCQGKASCTVSATNGVFGDPCGGTYKYLEVEYVCG